MKSNSLTVGMVKALQAANAHGNAKKSARVTMTPAFLQMIERMQKLGLIDSKYAITEKGQEALRTGVIK